MCANQLLFRHHLEMGQLPGPLCSASRLSAESHWPRQQQWGLPCWLYVVGAKFLLWRRWR